MALYIPDRSEENIEKLFNSPGESLRRGRTVVAV